MLLGDEMLYLKVQSEICRRIYSGEYRNGERIPSERALTEEFQASRVTVRKAIDDLENKGVLRRIQGSGTYVNNKIRGWNTDLNIIAVVASASTAFFTQFFQEFQLIANEHQAMVIFMQETPIHSLEDSIYKVYEKGVRNFVLWSERISYDESKIRSLRTIGVNMVVFDTDICQQYADCVFLDNKHAVSSLYHHMMETYGKKIIYIGWSGCDLFSLTERKKAYIELSAELSMILSVPWEKRKIINHHLEAMCKTFEAELKSSDAVLCENREIGIAVLHIFRKHDIDVPIGTLDESDEAKEYNLCVYEQDFRAMSQRVYDCLKEQNKKGEDWEAQVYPVEGALLKREHKC